MKYKQNDKILQLTEDTLIVGIDIAKHKHVARAQDSRGIQFGKPLTFENSLNGFTSLLNWVDILKGKARMRWCLEWNPQAIIGSP